MKQIVIVLMMVSLGGCSNITINGTICDQIASEPNTQNIPKECRKYDEKEAQKAFFKNKEKHQADVEDIIEFQQEKENK